ncbi:unnamed protein product [Adineta steineri]|uniref:Uncharacterized protein n=1 Tax=Adineta steineri TaxID=433720 RepID=A0A819W218_9BILA|nr:unnamed protein product [Adineta steineri]CAF4119265.1 unnamed protein product [Adineta steineri]
MILFVNSTPTSMGNSNGCYKDQTTDGTCKVDYECYTFCKKQPALNTENLPYPFNSNILECSQINTAGLCHAFCNIGTCYCYLISYEVTALLNGIKINGISATDSVTFTGTKVAGKDISAVTLICGDPTMST